MSAFGTKRTSQQCLAMSAFRGKANLDHTMSAFEPKRTSVEWRAAAEQQSKKTALWIERYQLHRHALINQFLFCFFVLGQTRQAHATQHRVLVRVGRRRNYFSCDRVIGAPPCFRLPCAHY